MKPHLAALLALTPMMACSENQAATPVEDDASPKSSRDASSDVESDGLDASTLVDVRQFESDLAGHGFELEATPIDAGATKLPTFLLYFFDAKHATMGTLGDARDFELQVSSDGLLEAATGFYVGSCDSFDVHEFSFRVMNGGIPEGEVKLEGRMAGKRNICPEPSDDVSSSEPFQTHFVATLDRTAPSISRYASRGDWCLLPAPKHLHVLDSLQILSEPLPASTTAVLAGNETEVALSPVEDRSSPRAIAAFAVSDTRPLPFSSDLEVRFDPQLSDLAGNTSDTSFRVRTIAEPPVFPQDGFESGLNASVWGEARLLEAGDASELGPLTGTRSLILEPGSRATLRIALAEGDSRLTFRYARGIDFIDISVASPSSTERVYVELEPTYDDFGPKPSGGAPPESTTAEVLLPPSFREEILLDLHIYSGDCMWPPPRSTLIIDDVATQ